MKKTPTTLRPEELPKELRPYLGGAVLDSSCSPEARVLYLADRNLYLKRAARGALSAEASMTAYFHGLGLSVEVVSYLSEEEDFLLTVGGRGEDATSLRYLSDGRRLSATLGEALRGLHETEAKDCPIPDRTADYLATVERNHARGVFDPSFLPKGWPNDADRTVSLLRHAAPQLRDRVLLHGDFCLPNVLLDDWRPTTYIDLGGAGIGDRHIDLFWGVWTLAYNLGTDTYRDTFLDAYGRDKVNEELLAVIAAAECFG